MSSKLNHWYRVTLLGALLASGCGSTIYYTSLVPPPRTLYVKPVSEVEVFVVTPPTRKSMTLGMFQAVQGVSNETAKTEIAQIREDAAKRGCDAILITSIDNPTYYSNDQGLSVHAGCIVFTDTDASAVSKPAPAPKPASNTPAASPPVQSPAMAPEH